MELTQKAKDLIAKVDAKKESDIKLLKQCKVPSPIIIYQNDKLNQKPRKAPQDLNRRKYTNWGGVDSVIKAGENTQRQSLAENYFS
jgi:hypothetical protein